jgi:DNA polymerase-3 subunit gamma/tau
MARAGGVHARGLSLLDQASRGTRLDAAEVGSLLGGAPFEMRARILMPLAEGDAATVLIELGALLDSGHEPRRVAEDLLRSARDAFLLTAGAGRVAVDGTDEERAALARSVPLWFPTVVRDQNL